MSHVTKDLSEKDAATLALQAKAAKMAPEVYLPEIVSRALERRRKTAAADLATHLDAMAEKVTPGATADDMEAAVEDALAAVRPHRTW